MSQPQQPPRPQPAAIFDPKTITVATYSGPVAGVLVIICFGGIILMFFGTAITDTLGLLLTVAETIYLLITDRANFYNGAGFWKVDQWGAGKRALLAALEVPFYFLALALYAVRLAALHYQRLDQPAPLAPPAKRKAPRR